MSLQDIGISGYRGKNSEIGVLKLFLDALKDGKIAPNSVLLIESLDRLSRDVVTAALGQFLAILKKGVEIVTLSDNQIYSDESLKKNPHQIYASLALIARANEESQIKSKRLLASWENKRKTLAQKNLQQYVLDG